MRYSGYSPSVARIWKRLKWKNSGNSLRRCMRTMHTAMMICAKVEGIQSQSPTVERQFTRHLVSAEPELPRKRGTSLYAGTWLYKTPGVMIPSYFGNVTSVTGRALADWPNISSRSDGAERFHLPVSRCGEPGWKLPIKSLLPAT